MIQDFEGGVVSELLRILTTFFDELFALLATIPDFMVTGSPEQVILKVGFVLALLVILFVFCIRMPLHSSVSPSVSLIMILAGIFFWVVALVSVVVALGRIDLGALMNVFRG